MPKPLIGIGKKDGLGNHEIVHSVWSQHRCRCLIMVTASQNTVDAYGNAFTRYRSDSFVLWRSTPSTRTSGDEALQEKYRYRTVQHRDQAIASCGRSPEGAMQLLTLGDLLMNRELRTCSNQVPWK